MPSVPPRPVAPTLTATGTVSDASNLTTYNFAAKAIGVAAADRVVLVLVCSDTAAPAISGVTVGGLTATKLIEASPLSIWAVSVPTGATATVSVTFASAALRCVIRTYAAFGLKSLTPVDTLSLTAGPAASVVGDIDVSDLGIALIAAVCSTAGAPITLNSEFSEASNADLELVRYAFGSWSPTPTDTLSVTASTSGAAGTWRAAAVSLR